MTVGRAKSMNIYFVPFIDFALVLLKSFIMISGVVCRGAALAFSIVYIPLLADWSCSYLKAEE